MKIFSAILISITLILIIFFILLQLNSLLESVNWGVNAWNSR